MKKYLMICAVLVLLAMLFACDSSGGEGGGGSEAEEAAAVAAFSAAEMTDEDPSPTPVPSPGGPYYDTPANVTYFGIFGGSVTYVIDVSPNYFNFHDFIVNYGGELYTLNGKVSLDSDFGSLDDIMLIDHNYKTTDLTITGGSLSGTYSLDLDVSISVDRSSGSEIIITGSVNGYAAGESVSLTIDEAVPLP